MAHQTIKIGNGWTRTDTGRPAICRKWNPVYHTGGVPAHGAEIPATFHITIGYRSLDDEKTEQFTTHYSRN